MVINENLLNEKRIHLDLSKWENYSWKAVRYKLPDNLIDGETYTASCTIKQGENGSGYSSITISGPKPGVVIPLPNEYLNIPISNLQTTFTYSSKNMKFIDFCTDVFGKTSDKTGTIVKAKIEPGDKRTPYIPHKNTLDPSKQAIFVAGGVFQEVYPV